MGFNSGFKGLNLLFYFVRGCSARVVYRTLSVFNRTRCCLQIWDAGGKREAGFNCLSWALEMTLWMMFVNGLRTVKLTRDNVAIISR